MDIELVGEDLWFPEGPVAMDDGSVILVEMRRKTLTRVLPNGKKEIVAEVGGGPNGAAIGPDGAMYVCNNGDALAWFEGTDVHMPDHRPGPYEGGSIQRVDLKTGKVTTLYDSCDGGLLHAPNDLVFDKHGGFWFTCLGWSDDEMRLLGALYYALPDGSKIVRHRRGMYSPNGVGISPDGKTLYMADCMIGRMWAFDITGPGEIAPPQPSVPGRVLATLPGYQWLDSLAMEADGKIAVGTLFNGGITVFDPDGSHEHIPFPDFITTNICFGGPDMRTAFVTCSYTGKLYKCRWPRPGMRLPFNA